MTVTENPTRPKAVGNPDPLREAIDRGESGDKVAVTDPAAAPLGTDDEAAGTPLTQAQVAQSLEAEVGNRPSDTYSHASAPVTSATPGAEEKPAHGGAWVVGALVLIAIILFAAVLLAQ